MDSDWGTLAVTATAVALLKSELTIFTMIPVEFAIFLAFLARSLGPNSARATRSPAGSKACLCRLRASDDRQLPSMMGLRVGPAGSSEFVLLALCKCKWTTPGPP